MLFGCKASCVGGLVHFRSLSVRLLCLGFLQYAWCVGYSFLSSEFIFRGDKLSLIYSEFFFPSHSLAEVGFDVKSLWKKKAKFPEKDGYTPFIDQIGAILY